MQLINFLDITKGSVIAVAGCGGKTSFIELLAGRLRDKKILISPTAKMFPVNMEGITSCETLEQCSRHEPHTGIQCLGLLNTDSGKLEALPSGVLAGLVPLYDVSLLEADGSRGLPCKGWLTDEPVVPDYCTHTVGIVTMNALGMQAAQTIVHRLPEFLALTGLNEGQTITLQALEAMVCDPRGMFHNSAGQRLLLVNQIEDDITARTAILFLQDIKTKYPNRFARLLFGSIHLDSWQEV